MKVRVSSSDVLVWRRVFTVGLCRCCLGSRDRRQASTLGRSPVHATLARALQVPFRLCSSLRWLRGSELADVPSRRQKSSPVCSEGSDVQAQRDALVERSRRAPHVAADANHNIGRLDSGPNGEECVLQRGQRGRMGKQRVSSRWRRAPGEGGSVGRLAEEWERSKQ